MDDVSKLIGAEVEVRIGGTVVRVIVQERDLRFDKFWGMFTHTANIPHVGVFKPGQERRFSTDIIGKVLS